MVRLKDNNSDSLLNRLKDFNSNMVRLKVTSEAGTLWYIKTFQFQYGSIKSLLQVYTSMVGSYFNSNMVRLKANVNEFAEKRTSISIPIWFD